MTSQMCAGKRWSADPWPGPDGALRPNYNSYKRLVPGYKHRSTLSTLLVPSRGAYPASSQRTEAKRIEFRPPDPTCTRTSPSPPCSWRPGRHRKAIDPGQPLEKNTYELSEEESAKMTRSGLLKSAGGARGDHEFL